MRQLVEQVFSTLHRLKERRADLKAPQVVLYPPRSGFESPSLRSAKTQDAGGSAVLLKSNDRSTGGGPKGSPG